MYNNLFYTNFFEDLNGNEYQLLIDKYDYTGTSFNIKMADAYSLTHTLRGGRDGDYNSVIGSELNFSILAENDDNLFKDASFDFNYLNTLSKFWSEYQFSFSNVSNTYSITDDLQLLLNSTGDDYGTSITQEVIIYSGYNYTVQIEHELVDSYNDSLFELILFNSDTDFQKVTINQNVEFDGTKTVKFNANSNYSNAGLILKGVDAFAFVRGAKLYRTINYFDLMTSDYKEFKVSLNSKRNLFQNHKFDTLQYWLHKDNGFNGWTYSDISKATIYVTFENTSDALYQSVYLNSGSTVNVDLIFGFSDSAFPFSKVNLMVDNNNIELCSGFTVKSGFTLTSLYTVNGFEYYNLKGDLYLTGNTRDIGICFNSTISNVSLTDFTIKCLQNDFTGWIQPDNMSRKFINNNYFIDINAIDGLATLKKINFGTANELGKVSTIVQHCLKQTGLNLPIEVQNNIREVSGIYWFDAYIDKSKWLTYDDRGIIEYENCYKVLEDILSTFYASVKQVNGRWLIANHSEIISNRLSVTSASTKTIFSDYNRKVNITGYPIIPDTDEMSMIQPYRGIITQANNNWFEDSFSYDSGFDNNIGGWSATTFTLVQHATVNNRNVIRAQINPSNFYGSLCKLKQIVYIPDNPPSYVTDSEISISFDIRFAAKRSYGFLNLYLYENRNGISGTTVTHFGRWEVSGMTTNVWYNLSTGLTNVSNYVRNDTIFEFELDTGVGEHNWDIYLDNIYLKFEFGTEPDKKSRYRLFNITGGISPAIENKEQELQFADTEFTGDRSALFKSNNYRNFTRRWKNADSSISGTTLIALYSNQFMRENQKYKRYIKVDVMDKTNKINNGSIFVFENVNYKLVGYSKQVLTGIVSVEGIEIRNDEVDTISDFYEDQHLAWTNYGA